MREAHALSGLDAAAFCAWQERAVGAHLAWARDATAWHRVHAAATLRDTPPLTRADLQEHGAELRAGERGTPMSSGGSTGEPVTVYHDAASRTWAFAAGAFLFERRGTKPWARRAFVWGEDDTTPAPGLRERLLPVARLNAFEMDDEKMARFAAELVRRPCVEIIGYATALALFSEFLLREQRWSIRPRSVISTAEALVWEQRQRMERAFRCKAYNVYGSRECAYLAWECPAGGLHVNGDGRLLEIVDSDGEPAPPGVAGRVLVTDFRNRAFGLIRYENGDVASWAEDRHRCPCGCVFPRLDRVHGRTSDFITTPAGEKIHGEWFTHLFYGRPGVARFQVRQPALRELEVLTTGTAGEPELSPLLDRIRARMGPDTRVTWRHVDEIPLTRAGKHRFTISDVPF